MPLPTSPTGIITRALSLAAVSASLLFVAMFLYVSLSRISYPFELEWLEGLSLQHVKRVLGPSGLYVKPTIDFIPNLYPPLHAYVGAVVCSVFGAHFTALRAISLLSALGVLALIYQFVARETSTRASLLNVPAIVAVGLFIATYDRVGGWFDIARVDSLLFFLVMLGLFMLRFYPSAGGFVVAGLFFVMAGFVKQSGFLIAVPLIGAVVLAHRRRGLYFGGAIGLVAAIVTVAVASLYEGNWFYYYVIDMPTRHPEVQGSAAESLWLDVIASMPISCLLACFAFFPGDGDAPRHRRIILGAFLVGGVGVSLAIRARVGAFVNDLIPAYLAVSILAGVGLERLFRHGRARAEWRLVPAYSLVLVLAQFWMLRYDPIVHIPTRDDRQAGERIVEQLKAIPGDVFLPHHGYLAEMAGKRSFAHTLAIDNLRLEDRGPNREFIEGQISSALAQKRFGAVIVESDGWNLDAIKEHYKPGQLLNTSPGVFFPREGGALRPEQVFVPK